VKSPTTLIPSSSNVFDLTNDSPSSPSRFGSQTKSQSNFYSGASPKSFAATCDSDQPKKRKFESDSTDDDEIAIISSKSTMMPLNLKRMKLGVSISSDSDDDDNIEMARKGNFENRNNSSNSNNSNSNNSNSMNNSRYSKYGNISENNNKSMPFSTNSRVSGGGEIRSPSTSNSAPSSEEKKRLKASPLIRLPSLEDVYSMLDNSESIGAPFVLQVEEIEESDSRGQFGEVNEGDESKLLKSNNDSGMKVSPKVSANESCHAMQVENASRVDSKVVTTPPRLKRAHSNGDGNLEESVRRNIGEAMEIEEAKSGSVAMNLMEQPREKEVESAVKTNVVSLSTSSLPIGKQQQQVSLSHASNDSAAIHVITAGQRYHLCSIHFTRVAPVRARIVSGGGVIDVKPHSGSQFLVTDQPNDTQVLTNRWRAVSIFYIFYYFFFLLLYYWTLWCFFGCGTYESVLMQLG
jgi:hypothetical protein